MKKGFIEIILPAILAIIFVFSIIIVNNHNENLYKKGEVIKIYDYKISKKPVNDNGGYLVFYTSAGKLVEGLGFDTHGNWKLIDNALLKKQVVICKARIYRPPFYNFKPDELRDLWDCKIQK